MKYQWVFVCALVAVLASSALGLKCYECTDKGDDHACGKMGDEFSPSGINVTDCPEPGKNETGHAVCGKTITEYAALNDPDNSGVIANRYCDIVDFKDQCWSKYGGGRTSTYMCVCSNEDKCNAAVATSVISLATLAAAVVAGSML